MGPDAMIFVYWMLSFKPAFTLSSFTLIKRLFVSSLLSAIKLVSFAYLDILFLAASSSSPHSGLWIYCPTDFWLILLLIRNQLLTYSWSFVRDELLLSCWFQDSTFVFHFWQLDYVSRCGSLWHYPIFRASWICRLRLFIKFGPKKKLTSISSNPVLLLSLFFLPGNPSIMLWLMRLHRFLRLCSFFILFISVAKNG